MPMNRRNKENGDTPGPAFLRSAIPKANLKRLLDREQITVRRSHGTIHPLYSYFDDSLFNQK
jgi:hypothetical protein